MIRGEVHQELLIGEHTQQLYWYIHPPRSLFIVLTLSRLRHCNATHHDVHITHCFRDGFSRRNVAPHGVIPVGLTRVIRHSYCMTVRTQRCRDMLACIARTADYNNAHRHLSCCQSLSLGRVTNSEREYERV